MADSSELSTLTALAQRLSSPSDLKESIEATLDSVGGRLGTEMAWVWLLDERSGEEYLAFARGVPDDARDHPKILHGDLLDTFGLAFHASVPLALGARPLGSLHVAARAARELVPDDLGVLTVVATLVSFALERDRMEAEAARPALAESQPTSARDRYDAIANELAGASWHLEAAEQLAAQTKQRLRERITSSFVVARAALGEARRSVFELRSTPLEAHSLPDALQALAANARHADGRPLDTRVSLIGFDVDRNLPAAAEAGLFRIAQQALASLARQDGVRGATIHLARAGTQIRLLVEEQGGAGVADSGPLPAAPDNLALAGMNECARSLGGILSIDRRPGAGTAFRVTIPAHR
jgi:two-component system, NarL family, sensor kinase